MMPHFKRESIWMWKRGHGLNIMEPIFSFPSVILTEENSWWTDLFAGDFLFFFYFFDWGDKRSQFYVPFLSVLDEQLINRPSWRQKRKQQRRESKWLRYRTHIALVELKVLLTDFWTTKFWPLVLGWHRRRNPEFKLQPPHSFRSVFVNILGLETLSSY